MTWSKGPLRVPCVGYFAVLSFLGGREGKANGCYPLSQNGMVPFGGLPRGMGGEVVHRRRKPVGAAAALADCHCVHKWTTPTIVEAAAYAADAQEVMFYF